MEAAGVGDDDGVPGSVALDEAEFLEAAQVRGELLGGAAALAGGTAAAAGQVLAQLPGRGGRDGRGGSVGPSAARGVAELLAGDLRVPGKGKGRFRVRKDFDAPLPEEVLDAFEGR